MRKQVIFCTDGIFPHAIGGMQRHSRLLIEQLAKHDLFDITVIHPHAVKTFDNNLGIEEIPIRGIKIERNYLLECYKYSRRVSAILEKYPDAVIYSQGLSVWHNCNQFKDRLIINPHGLEPYQALSIKDKLIGLPFRLIFNYIFSNSKYVVSLGGKLTTILQTTLRDKSKIITIPNAVNTPVDSNTPREINEDGSVLQALFVSRFAHNKGIGILMEAVTRLNKGGFGQRYHFKLAGKGPLFDYYTTNHRHENVEYLGFVDDDELEKLYTNADLFVFPTLFEGMPTVVLEAMAKELPIIVSDTGATAELVDSNNGFLINKNDVNALYTALLSFSNLSDRERRSMSEASVEKVLQRFNWDKVAEETLQLISAV